jgi:hypothetical protein
MAKGVKVRGEGRGAAIGVLAALMLYGAVTIGPIILSGGLSSLSTWLAYRDVRQVEASLIR